VTATCWTIERGYLVVCRDDLPIHRERVPAHLAGMPRGTKRWAMNTALAALSRAQAEDRRDCHLHKDVADCGNL
jgi:hypothetical protein